MGESADYHRQKENRVGNYCLATVTDRYHLSQAPSLWVPASTCQERDILRTSRTSLRHVVDFIPLMQLMNASGRNEKYKQRSTKHYTENQRSSNMKPTKNQCDLRCSGRISSSCSTSGSRRGYKPGNKSWMRKGSDCDYDKMSREHIRDHLWHRYSVTSAVFYH
jgi:hypothetical protein